MKYIYWAALAAFLVTTACQENNSTQQLYQLPTKTAKGGVQAIIEIPAGTNHKIEYDVTTKTFAVDSLKGKERIINFLPYPGNYGFISSTLMDSKRGGDGDALDVLVLSESLPTGTPVETIPIAALLLEDNGKLDTKIIAVPADPSLRIIEATDFKDFFIEYDSAKRLIQEWFLNYKGAGEMELIGWRDEVDAMREIEKWQLQK